MKILIVSIIGLVAGIMSGLFGIGGGVIIVPSLIILAKIPQIDANGASLAGLLLPVGFFAVIQYYKKKLVEIPSSVLLLIGIVIGSFWGSKIAVNLPATVLKKSYAIFLFYVSYRFIDPIDMIKKNKKENIIHKMPKPVIRYPIVFITGILAGLSSGLFGIGGAAIIIPVLVGLLNYDQKYAAGTSLGALLLPVGLPGVITYYKAGHVNLLYGTIIALGLLFGAFFGAKLALNLPSKLIKRLYGFFLLAIAIGFIFSK